MKFTQLFDLITFITYFFLIFLITDYMQSLCKNHFLQQIYRKIDGALLWSQNERNLDCIITFQTHSILQRFMLRFDMLQLDCNDHLYIYDGAHAVGTHKVSKKKKKPLNTFYKPYIFVCCFPMCSTLFIFYSSSSYILFL